jgi:homocysteine S-methyltransferase
MVDVDETSAVVVLDGGLSTVLEQQGANLTGALWTARLVGEEPARIVEAHRAFYGAGARVATTATYQATVERFVAGGYDEHTARQLIVRSVTLAQDARDELADTSPGLLVAASVGPYGAFLAVYVTPKSPRTRRHHPLLPPLRLQDDGPEDPRTGP